MDVKRILRELQDVSRANGKFLQQRNDEIVGLLLKENVTAEEALQQEILSELMDKIHRINYLVQYIEKNRIQEGILDRDQKGNILFNREIMAPMKEIEVYLHDNQKKRMVWTRTFVSMTSQGEPPYLVGLGKNLKINKIKARIRI